MNSPKKLKARFPYMFSDNNLGYGFALGWFPSFVVLCEDIDQLLGPDKRGFHWTQLKEKMGSGRYHYAIAPSNALADTRILGSIRKLVESAESDTMEMCIYCGEAGSMHNNGGYVLVRCDRHRRLAESGTLESPWFDGGDL